MAKGHKNGTRFSLAFKQQVLERVINGGETQSAVAEAKGLSHQTVFNWVKAYKEGKIALKGEDAKSLKRAAAKTSAPSTHAPVTTRRPGRASNAEVVLLELRVQRLEAELTYAKAINAALEIAVDALS